MLRFKSLAISLSVTTVSSILLYLYFKNKMSNIEKKIDTMFKLIQDYEKSNYQNEMYQTKGFSKNMNLDQCLQKCSQSDDCIAISRDFKEDHEKTNCYPRNKLAVVHSNRRGNAKQRKKATQYNTYVKSNVPNQIVSPGNNKPIIGVFQDSLIGSFLFTRKEQKLTKKQIMNLLMKTNCFNTTTLFEDTSKKSYNTFDVISEILPNISLNYKTDLFGKSGDTYDSSNFVLDIQNGKINRGQFDKGVLGGSSKGILHRILKDYNNEKCHHFIDNLQGIITEYMKTTGFSVGISDLIADEDTNDKINSTILEKKKEVSNLIDKIHLGIIKNQL